MTQTVKLHPLPAGGFMAWAEGKALGKIEREDDGWAVTAMGRRWPKRFACEALAWAAGVSTVASQWQAEHA